MQRTPRPIPARSEKKQETPQTTKLANAAIIGLSGLTVLGLAAAVAQQEQAQMRSAEVAATYTPEVQATIPPARKWAPVDAVVKRLGDASEPWTLTVLGDSTGAVATGWVNRTAEKLAEETGRPATIHTWSVDTNSYDSTTDISGNGEPIVVWNGSASGERAAYTLEHRKEMAPEPSDLVIINHGHNQWNPNNTTTEVGALAAWVKNTWDTAPALAVTLQNARTGEGAEGHNQRVRALQNRWEDSQNVALIDVHTAFKEADDLGALLSGDELHPSDEGQQLWSDTVWAALKFGDAT